MIRLVNESWNSWIFHKPLLELHISRKARDYYQFDEGLYGLSGNVVFADFYMVRKFAQQMNAKRDVIRFPERAVHSGDIHAMGLIDEINHWLLGRYREEHPGVLGGLLEYLQAGLGTDVVDRVLQIFIDLFPPLRVYRNEQEPADYLSYGTEAIPNRHLLLEELLMLWLANRNPAFSPYQDLIDEAELSARSDYRQFISLLAEFFDGQPRFGPDNQSIPELLLEPVKVAPTSFPGQLSFILKKWSALLGPFLSRILSGLDLLEEENRIRFGGLGTGHGTIHPPHYKELEEETEAFSKDLDWMPKVVMIAKNAFVWLEQLSRKYGRWIRYLNDIPDEELDELARRGLTVLWFIGIWRRSAASKKIKHLCGNSEAEASAYSLNDYEISEDLGGWDSFHALKKRAWRRGIRMAGDMVPNHVGIDARWVIEHPDWFIGLDEPPYPSYQFEGPNLSEDGRVGIYLESHYYDRTDAAVVFKRVDHSTGSVRYLYHGNDGTSMPWNDTAQIDFLNPAAREAVIRTIIHVARNFPVIRLDAAMTLVKKHIRRLWYPEPGSGGAIPSRAGQSISLEEFNRAMPVEFWREVVDRVAEEAPDTLLLAEAFWMLEGYFVRTLGMHRVYNSAFMNMLKMEDNAGYRRVIKETLEYNPEILKRFVNFMNNPDEDTAIAQFGRDDKYFGVCILMATLPGLPMFGHGQIEGFTEKYGMEYRYPRMEERPDHSLVERHEREIFPVLRKRWIFSGVENFLLYDFYTADGGVNENVFAYSNRAGEERSLVVYHNTYDRTSGWIKTSAAYLTEDAAGESGKILQQRVLKDGLNLSGDPDCYVLFRDQVSGLTYIRRSSLLCSEGLFVSLEAFTCHVFLDIREVRDTDGKYARLEAFLDGHGVPDLDTVARDLIFKPMHDQLGSLLHSEPFRRLLTGGQEPELAQSSLLIHLVNSFFEEVAVFSGYSDGLASLKKSTAARLSRFIRFETVPAVTAKGLVRESKRLLSMQKRLPVRAVLAGWIICGDLGSLQTQQEEAGARSRAMLDEYQFGHALELAFKGTGLTRDEVSSSIQLIHILSEIRIEPDRVDPAGIMRRLFRHESARWYLGVHRYHDLLWFHKESFEYLLDMLLLITLLEHPAFSQTKKLSNLKKTALQAGYQVEKMLDALSGPGK
ncbi:alpha-amylase [bacterium]|nr:alpha-amylase [bacterium]